MRKICGIVDYNNPMFLYVFIMISVGYCLLLAILEIYAGIKSNNIIMQSIVSFVFNTHISAEILAFIFYGRHILQRYRYLNENIR